MASSTLTSIHHHPKIATSTHHHPKMATTTLTSIHHHTKMAITTTPSIHHHTKMAITTTPSSFKPHPNFLSILPTKPRTSPSLSPSTKRLITLIPQSKSNDSIDPPDRLVAAITYFYPFFDGVQYGKYVITQFTPIQTLIQPLVPAIRVFKSFPFNGILVFFTLYFVVVRNPNFSRYVRFNTMQAIVLDVLLIFPDLLERGFNPKDGLGLDLMMSFDSTVFLFLLVSLIYGSGSCLFGKMARLPIVAEAADRQVM